MPFSPGRQGADDFVPQPGDHADGVGAVIVGGRRVSVSGGLDPRGNSIRCIYPARVSIRRGEVCGPDVVDAMAAGPLLLAHGERQSFRDADPRYAAARHPRTSFGMSADGQKASIVVVDGRQTVTSEGAALVELTDFFRDLGASDAINLDGGGSTTLAVAEPDGSPRVLNSPIHTGVPGRERPVANHLGVRLQPTP